jgi:hydroxyethylthiazole kinase-like uncharacterized protein yjeF
MREWEQATWATGQSEAEVIRRVGETVAFRALQLTQGGDFILIVAGKGNNGQDARRAADYLPGRRVEIVEAAPTEATAASLAGLLSQRPALVIDGLFGIGLNRPLDDDWCKVIMQINNSRAQVLSVDVPSGLNADTGEPMGAAIQASVTLTVGAPKAGLLRAKAWQFVGRLEVAANVGLAHCPVTSEFVWVPPEDFSGYPPPRPAAVHKGSYGHAAIVAGSMGYHGAAVLAARAAQRAQPGLVTLHASEPIYHVVASQLQAVMVAPWVPATKLPGSQTAVLIGPGLAARDLPDQVKLLTRHLWRDSPLPIVVDASALDWIPLDPVPKFAIRVMTPHPGEAARLLRSTPQQVQSARPEAVRDISRRFGDCWVVLKGHQTLIGRSNGEMYVNSSGNPHLAQGGSGDVLAGYMTGLLAQPPLQAHPLKAILHAVWQHGAAAEFLSATRRNWVIEDLVEKIGDVETGL